MWYGGQFSFRKFPKLLFHKRQQEKIMIQTLNDIIHKYTVRAQYQQKNWNCVSRRASPQAAAVRKKDFLFDYSGIE